MSRHVKVPTQLLDSKISNSAKVLWIHFARIATPKRPQVSAHTALLAEKMGLSVRSIQRLLKELVKAELLVHQGYIDGRVKVYSLIKIPSVSQNLTLNPSPATGEGLENPILPCLLPSPLGGEGLGVRSNELTPQMLEEWSNRFPGLDGQSGRPTLVHCVEQAVNHPMRNQELSLNSWVDLCLKQDARRYAEEYWREKYNLDQRFQAAVHR